MAKRAAPKDTNKVRRNDDRPNGKAWKKNPGVANGAFNSKSEKGYSLKKLKKDLTKSPVDVGQDKGPE